MKTQKFQVAALALILGIGSAVASNRPSSLTNHKWSRDAQGIYTDITGEQKGTDYNCDASSNVCTATYPQGQDPNTNPNAPVSVELGDFR